LFHEDGQVKHSYADMLRRMCFGKLRSLQKKLIAILVIFVVTRILHVNPSICEIYVAI
jgi:hypothetical protein